MTFGDRFKEIRLFFRCSQTEFGDALEVTQAMISKTELNEREPNLKLLGLLITVYSININWLITGDGKMFNPQNEPEKQSEPSSEKLDSATTEIFRWLYHHPGDRDLVHQMIKGKMAAETFFNNNPKSNK